MDLGDGESAIGRAAPEALAGLKSLFASSCKGQDTIIDKSCSSAGGCM